MGLLPANRHRASSVIERLRRLLKVFHRDSESIGVGNKIKSVDYNQVGKNNKIQCNIKLKTIIQLSSQWMKSSNRNDISKNSWVI